MIMSNPSQYTIPYIPGATTVGVTCPEGVVLASEKRVSYGYLVMSRSMKKVFKLTDRIGAACAGLVSDMQVLARQVTAYANLFRLEYNRSISVKATAKIMSNLLFDRRLMPLITQTIVGGIDEEGPSIYALDILGSLISDKFTVAGSGAELAVGILEEEYRDDMTINETKDLIERTVKSAVSRDVMSGDGIDYLIITEKGIREETKKF